MILPAKSRNIFSELLCLKQCESKKYFWNLICLFRDRNYSILMLKTIRKSSFCDQICNQEIFCKDGFCHQCSALRNSDGNWMVPYGHWNGDKWNRNGNWTRNDWNSNYRVVLFDNQQIRKKKHLLRSVFSFPAI